MTQHLHDWQRELERAYAARGVSVRLHALAHSSHDELAEISASPPASLASVLRAVGAIDELGEQEASSGLTPLMAPKKIVAHTLFARAVHHALRELIVIGGRAAHGETVYFVMSGGDPGEQVGLYWPTYDELEWTGLTLPGFLLGVAAGWYASDSQLAAIDSLDPRAAAARVRQREAAACAANEARNPSRPTPLRPADAHIAQAFDKKSPPEFAPPVGDVRAVLRPVCADVPAVLLDLLSTTNGVFDADDQYWVLFSAEEIVERTAEARGRSECFDSLLAIGGPGVDGILFVMDEGAKSNGVGVYDPIDDEVHWPCERLSEFVNRWFEGSLLL